MRLETRVMRRGRNPVLVMGKHRLRTKRSDIWRLELNSKTRLKRTQRLSTEIIKIQKKMRRRAMKFKFLTIGIVSIKGIKLWWLSIRVKFKKESVRSTCECCNLTNQQSRRNQTNILQTLNVKLLMLTRLKRILLLESNWL